MRFHRVLALAALCGFWATDLRAVPPINRDAYPESRYCRARPLSSSKIAAAGGDIRRALIANASGVKRIAVILVNFPSAHASATSGSSSIANLPTVQGYFDDFESYYSEVSYSILDLQLSYYAQGTAAVGGSGSVAAAGAPYVMPQAMEYYGCGDVDSGCSGVSPVAPPGTGGAYLIRDALKKVKDAFPAFTAASQGFDAVMILHAGYGNESTSRNGDIWSAVYQEAAIINQDATGFFDGAVFPALESGGYSPMGVIAHEFGHILSLPDLYNTLSLGGSSVVGNWDLMDSGTYLGSGSNPAHLGAWCKWALGWTNPQSASDRGSYSLPYAELPVVAGAPSTAFVRIPVSNGLPQEYFLIEHRSKTSGAAFDQHLPGSGLLIWHVDDQLTTDRAITVPNTSLANTVNSGAPHYGVSVVTADGMTISNTNKGNAANLFADGDVFTSPKSDNFNGDPSGANVVSISGAGAAAVSFDVVNLAVTTNQTISRAASYPNPAGKGYGHPQGEGRATLTFQLTRPASDYSILLYTLSGEQVRTFGKDAIDLNITRSQDRKWVYEALWDLKNGDGAHVAPGVYLVLFRADGESKTVKTVVIR